MWINKYICGIPGSPHIYAIKLCHIVMCSAWLICEKYSCVMHWTMKNPIGALIKWIISELWAKFNRNIGSVLTGMAEAYFIQGKYYYSHHGSLETEACRVYVIVSFLFYTIIIWTQGSVSFFFLFHMELYTIKFQAQDEP